jgi:4-hydroxy 2-oxovalerate aldolase
MLKEDRVMYRPQIKVVDCTIRDGGLANDSYFNMDTVRAVYEAVCRSGVDYVELGYRNSKKMFSPEEYGPWRFCDEEHLRHVTDGIDPGETKIAVMQDAHKAEAEDILPADESVVDMIRIATYVKDIDKAIHLANNATDKGYEATVNIMAISKEGPPFLEEALQQIEQETRVQAVYVVDSFGALYSEEVHFLVELYQMHIKTKEVGVHFHNNQQLAFANTVEGIIKGANYMDGALYGLGRAAGNCPLELLLGFLKNPKFDLVPLLEVIGKYIIPLTLQLDWGYHIPYMLTGIRNEHPREAMAWMNGPRKHDYVTFYQRLIDEVAP